MLGAHFAHQTRSDCQGLDRQASKATTNFKSKIRQIPAGEFVDRLHGSKVGTTAWEKIHPCHGTQKCPKTQHCPEAKSSHCTLAYACLLDVAPDCACRIVLYPLGSTTPRLEATCFVGGGNMQQSMSVTSGSGITCAQVVTPSNLFYEVYVHATKSVS